MRMKRTQYKQYYRRETGRWQRRWCVVFADGSLNYYHSQKVSAATCGPPWNPSVEKPQCGRKFACGKEVLLMYMLTLWASMTFPCFVT